MSFNKKQLAEDTKNALKKVNKPNPFSKDVIVDPAGQWKHPGKITRIPGNNITMKGVTYPLLGVDSNGNKKMMLPGKDYRFPGAQYVTEYPFLQTGGNVLTNFFTPEITDEGIITPECPDGACYGPNYVPEKVDDAEIFSTKGTVRFQNTNQEPGQDTKNKRGVIQRRRNIFGSIGWKHFQEGGSNDWGGFQVDEFGNIVDTPINRMLLEQYERLNEPIMIDDPDQYNQLMLQEEIEQQGWGPAMEEYYDLVYDRRKAQYGGPTTKEPTTLYEKMLDANAKYYTPSSNEWPGKPQSGAIEQDYTIEDLLSIGAVGKNLFKTGYNLYKAFKPKYVGTINIGSHPKSIKRAVANLKDAGKYAAVETGVNQLDSDYKKGGAYQEIELDDAQIEYYKQLGYHIEELT